MSDDNKEFDPEETQGEEAAEQGSDSIQAETAVEETPELDSDSNSDDALDAKSSQAAEGEDDSEDGDKEEVIQNGPMFLENELEGAYDFELSLIHI